MTSAKEGRGVYTVNKALAALLVPLATLNLDPKNARLHPPRSIKAIKASLTTYGQQKPIITKDKTVIAGNGTVIAARELFWTHIAALEYDRDDLSAMGFKLADNRTADLSTFDGPSLIGALEFLGDKGFNMDIGSLWTEREIEAIRTTDSSTNDGLTDPDDAPALPKKAVTKSCDLWSLGAHRLYCGDATNITHVSALMGSDQADMVFTDPPYNVDYEGYTDEKLTIKNDNMSDSDFQRFLSGTFDAYKGLMKKTGSIYVCHPSSQQMLFEKQMVSAGFDIRCQIIWAKNTFAWGHGRYKFQHEPIFYAFIKGETDHWYGDKTQSTLWQENKPAANRLHPTMKPVDLILRAIHNSSKPGDIVADLFGGSGSTLIACEQTGRSARLMELDPRYCDVIIERWQRFTGKKAKRAA